MKKTIKYIVTFILTMLTLILILVLASSINSPNIKKHLIESAEYLDKKPGIDRIQNKREYTYLHTYADSVLLNIINYIEPEKPLKSILQSRFYQKLKIDTNADFVTAIEEKQTANDEYSRYWHGSISIIRPLLFFFNIKQIYTILLIIFLILYSTFIFTIFKKSKKIAIGILISSFAINIFLVPFCLEYFWTIALMMITSIVVIKNEKYGEERLKIIFFITGILTCYFDFLSTETLTYTVPIMLIFLIRKDESKENIKLIISTGIVWLMGYIGAWLVKWILCALVYDKNIFLFIGQKLLVRVNGEVEDISRLQMYIEAITKNINTLFPLNIVQRKWKLIIPTMLIIMGFIMICDKKKIRKNNFFYGLVLLSSIPYVRYLVLANHSYRHSFFTFRAQMVTIIGIFFIILDLADKEKMKKILRYLNKDIKIQGEKRK